jgi:type II secretory pathway component GspD/PulD (secretin)
MRYTFAAVLFLAVSAVFAAPVARNATIEVVDKPVVEVLKDIASQTGETVLVEKLVAGTVTAKLKDVSAENAIEAVAKSAKLQWRKIYVLQGSVLAKDADALAAQMRTVLAVRFPDIVIGSEGSGGSFMHVQKEAAANELTKSIPPAAGMVAVYLVTDDAKAYKKELADASKKKVAKYIDQQKEMMKSFIEMTPEERQATVREGLLLANQISLEMMQEMMNSMMDTDPQYLSDVSNKAMSAIMSMSVESRKAMFKHNMIQQQEMFKSMPPEQLQQFQQEMQEVAQELQKEGAGE